MVGAVEQCGPHAAALNPPQAAGSGSSGYSSDADTDAEGNGRPQSGARAAAATAQTLFAWSAPASPHLTVQREGATAPNPCSYVHADSLAHAVGWGVTRSDGKYAVALDECTVHSKLDMSCP